jgi:N-acetyl sugar amidotransferase
MEKCIKCGFPNTRPNTLFVDGVCGACINYAKRDKIDWGERNALLETISDTYRKKNGYDCIVAVSGGKDSYYIVHTVVKELGMHPLLVTVSDSFTHTKAGHDNLYNLVKKFNLNHMTYMIGHDTFKRATRIAFEATGEPLKFVEYAIYTIPVILAKRFKIPLIFFGENSAYEYGSTMSDDYRANPAITAIAKRVKEDKEWWIDHGLTEDEVSSIIPDLPLDDYVDVVYMSYFRPWSSVKNLKLAQEYGFQTLEGEWDRKGTIENFEQMDSVAYLLHLWMKYPKFGFQRSTDIATRRVREGLLTREQADKLIAENDPILDPWALKDFCQTIGYSEKEFWEIVSNHKREDISLATLMAKNTGTK